MNPRSALQKYLMASYAYYIRYASVMPDAEYDMLAKVLRTAWPYFDHQHKHLVTLEDLNAGTLFRLKEEDYPMIVKQAAEMWIRKTEEGKQYAGG